MIYDICPILYPRKVISSIKTIEFGFILIIFLYFKISQRMRGHKIFCLVLIVSLPAWITWWPALILTWHLIQIWHPWLVLHHLPDNWFLNKTEPFIPNNMPRYAFSLFCFIFNCFITRLINKPVSSRDLTFYMISSISSFEIINVAVTELRFFFFFYKYLHLLLILLLLILMISQHWCEYIFL